MNVAYMTPLKNAPRRKCCTGVRKSAVTNLQRDLMDLHQGKPKHFRLLPGYTEGKL